MQVAVPLARRGKPFANDLLEVQKECFSSPPYCVTSSITFYQILESRKQYGKMVISGNGLLSMSCLLWQQSGMRAS